MKFRTTMEKGNPPQGIIKCVVSLKDNTGGRWEYDGKLPLHVAHTLMAISASGGKSNSLKAGQDEAITAAFAAIPASNKEQAWART